MHAGTKGRALVMFIIGVTFAGIVAAIAASTYNQMGA